MALEVRVCTVCFKGDQMYANLRDNLAGYKVCQTGCLGGCAFQKRVDVINGSEKTSLGKIPSPLTRIHKMGENPVETIRGYLQK